MSLSLENSSPWPLSLPSSVTSERFKEFAAYCYTMSSVLNWRKTPVTPLTGALHAMGRCFGFGFSQTASWLDLAMTAEFIAFALEDEGL